MLCLLPQVPPPGLFRSNGRSTLDLVVVRSGPTASTTSLARLALSCSAARPNRRSHDARDTGVGQLPHDIPFKLTVERKCRHRHSLTAQELSRHGHNQKQVLRRELTAVTRPPDRLVARIDALAPPNGNVGGEPTSRSPFAHPVLLRGTRAGPDTSESEARPSAASRQSGLVTPDFSLTSETRAPVWGLALSLHCVGPDTLLVSVPTHLRGLRAKTANANRTCHFWRASGPARAVSSAPSAARSDVRAHQGPRRPSGALEGFRP